MIKLPIKLKRTPANPADVRAVLCFGDDYRQALAICHSEELDPAGRIFRVADGLLVTFPRSMRGAYPAVQRLRSLAPNLYLPVDAELFPALLDDEAAALAKHQGLVFLHHGRSLAFDFHSPIPLDQMLKVAMHPARPWSPLPDSPVLASRIDEFVFASIGTSPDQPESAEEQADRILDPRTDPALGSPEAGQPSASGVKGVAGRAAMGIGKGLMAFGAALGQRGLAALGAKMIQGAINMAPKLSEAIVGKQSAALRELLQRFRDGDVEGALKRALPLDDSPAPRGASASAGGQLPHNDLAYRLSEFLGGSKSDSTAYWTAESDLREALAREYRRAAAIAMERGDHRRAALIYAKLLHDFREAAKALSRGGLHQDAAAIYLAKLRDHKAAALEYEAAGDFDRAVELFRKTLAHEAAGELLRRIGEEAAAVEEFALAADQHLVRNNYLAAGDLLLKKAYLRQKAEECYRAAWNQKSALNRGACGQRLAAMLASESRAAEILVLLDEAPSVFHSRSFDLAASAFYHEVAELASQSTLIDFQLEIRDRVRLALAARLHDLASSTGPPSRNVVSSLLGGTASWTTAAASDAEFSLAKLTKKSTQTETATRKRSDLAPIPGVGLVPIPGVGSLSAYCFAPGSEDLFLGFEGGQVYCCRLSDMSVQFVAEYSLPVSSLATTQDGQGVVVLRAIEGESRGMLSSHVRQGNGTFDSLGGIRIDSLNDPWITPIVASHRGDLFGLWDGARLTLVEAWTQCSTSLVVTEEEELQGSSYGFLLGPGGSNFLAVLHQGSSWWSCGGPDGSLDYICASDGLEMRGRLRHAAITPIWFPDRTLAFSYISRSGAMQWRAVRFRDGYIGAARGGSSDAKHEYLATSVVKPGLVVAVTRTQVDYYSIGQGGSWTKLKGSKHGRFNDVIAVVPCRKNGSLILIYPNGYLLRLGSHSPRLTGGG